MLKVQISLGELYFKSIILNSIGSLHNMHTKNLLRHLSD